MRYLDPMCMNGRGEMSKGRIWFLWRRLRVGRWKHSDNTGFELYSALVGIGTEVVVVY